MQKPNVLLLGASDEQDADLRKALKDVANLNRLNVPAELVPDEMRRLRSGTAIVAISPQTPQRFGLIHNITASGGVVIVVSPTKDPELILRAMRAGAREFVLESDHEELRVAVRSQAKSAEQADGLGTAITIFGAKGGVGSTTIATNLAGAMARKGMRVCLVDLNLHLGDVLSFMDVTGGYSISDVVTNMTRLDRDLLDSSMTKHSSGVNVLAQSGKMEEADQIKATDVVGLLQFLRKNYDKVIIDGVRAFDELSLAALDGSQFLLMMMTQDVPAVRNGQRCIELFTRLGYDETKIKLILNRYQKSSKITPDVIAETLKQPVAHLIANDFVSVIDSINRGMLLSDVAPRAKLTQDIEDLVPLLSNERKVRVRRPSILGSLFGKKVADGTA
ncbi:MAG: pilus assembly protein CpaE [Myxococcales bacterium]|jgi:pilus assembly protein CpaE|nr:pilus assembly protein CpaE [Myxococcales bacterium]